MIQRIRRFFSTHEAVEDNGNEYTVTISPENLLNTARFVHKELRGVVSSVFCVNEDNGYTLYQVFNIRAYGFFIILKCFSETPGFQAISPSMHAASWFEQEIQDLLGVTMEGHLDPGPLVLFPENWPSGKFPLRKDFPWNLRPPLSKDRYVYNRVEGEGIYEIPVGPVHAGVIEPGHFRFSVAGEPIIKLEARLFWKHKGIEKLFEGRDPVSAVHLAERISGDESFSHALAYMHSIERICGISVALRAEYLRGIFAELERISMHLFDIGNICIGTAFNFGGANLWRLKEMLMREMKRICGSRFLRGLICFGGINRDISDNDLSSFRQLLKNILSEFESIVKIMQSSASILDRLKTTAPLRRDVALDFGAVGVVARGSGNGFDARFHLPYSVYRIHRPNIAVETGGDVYARTLVRIAELRESIRYIGELADHMPKGDILSRDVKVEDGSALGWAETPRGFTLFWTEIRGGRIRRLKVSPASFANWHCMPQAIHGLIVPDFPLLNKSFGLSYSGCDR